MNLEQADIMLHSNINQNCYYLFKDKIIVETERNKYQEIIVASRDCYDRVFMLDENNLSIMFVGLTK